MRLDQSQVTALEEASKGISSLTKQEYWWLDVDEGKLTPHSGNKLPSSGSLFCCIGSSKLSKVCDRVFAWLNQTDRSQPAPLSDGAARALKCMRFVATKADHDPLYERIGGIVNASFDHQVALANKGEWEVDLENVRQEIRAEHPQQTRNSDTEYKLDPEVASLFPDRVVELFEGYMSGRVADGWLSFQDWFELHRLAIRMGVPSLQMGVEKRLAQARINWWYESKYVKNLAMKPHGPLYSSVVQRLAQDLRHSDHERLTHFPKEVVKAILASDHLSLTELQAWELLQHLSPTEPWTSEEVCEMIRFHQMPSGHWDMVKEDSNFKTLVATEQVKRIEELRAHGPSYTARGLCRVTEGKIPSPPLLTQTQYPTRCGARASTISNIRY